MLFRSQPGILSNGNGSLTYNITGSANATGTAYFNIVFGGQSCSFSINFDANTVNNQIYPFDFIIQPPHPQLDQLELTIIPSDAKVKNILIYDATGKLIYSENNPSIINGYKNIDISFLSKGVYVIKMLDASSNSIRSKRFIKG